MLTASVGHGCEGSPTTRVAIKIPEEITAVTPTRHPLWRVEKKMVRLHEPVTDAHGNTVTERVDQVVFTAREPLPDGVRDTFELSLTLPDAAGETLAFPTVQTCEQGRTGWVETAAEGQDPDELDAPAPTVTITEGTGAGHGADATDTDAEADEATGSASDAGSGNAGSDTGSDSASDTGSDTLAVSGLVAGVLGLLAGGAALLRVRRRP